MEVKLGQVNLAIDSGGNLNIFTILGKEVTQERKTEKGFSEQ